MASSFNIDFHCHPTLRSTNCATDLKELDFWKKVANYKGDSTIERMIGIKLSEIAKESQSHFSGYRNGNTKIIFDSLYPLEKGWLNFRKLPSIFMGEDIKLRIFRIASGITEKRFNDLRSNESYFNELNEQYSILLREQKKKRKNHRFQLTKNYDHLTSLLDKKDVDLIVVPSIEGAHSFGTGDMLAKGKTPKELKSVITENIARVKQWEYPPFFVGLAHHFWNQLCGHARSFKPPVHYIINQRVGLNQGITELGWSVIHNLLSTDNGRRIHIGIKHMSIKARMEYYRFVYEHNIISKDTIPIICSHTGVNGFNTINRMVKFADSRKSSRIPMFNNLSMNLCAEEIKVIHETGGIIGIILDKEILGSSKYLDAIRKEDRWQMRKKMYLKLIWDTIFFMINSIKTEKAWDTPIFSSDFDGLITQIEFYKCADSIQELREDLQEFLEQNNYKRELWFKKSPEEILDKLFRGNVMNFLQKHYIA